MNKKWIDDTSLLFYQIFSGEYECEDFWKTLTLGGGGNSPLCATWEKFSGRFVLRRISKNAYERLMTMLNDDEKKLVVKEGDVVSMPNDLIVNTHHGWFRNNAKTLKKRRENGKEFHMDHNPSNKKVLVTLKELVNKNKNKKNYVNDLSVELETIQTIDLITIEEDNIRTSEDKKSKLKLSGKERDKLIGSEFYYLKLY